MPSTHVLHSQTSPRRRQSEQQYQTEKRAGGSGMEPPQPEETELKEGGLSSGMSGGGKVQ